MADRSELSAYASQLGNVLRQMYGGTISDRFEQIFVSESLRLGASDNEDLAGLIFLECHDFVSQGGALDDKSLKRIVHRVRRRIVRRARRETPLDPTLLDQQSHDSRKGTSPQLSEAVVRRIIEQLSPDEALVLHCSVFEGRAPRDIADALGISLATVYRRLKSARQQIAEIVD
jgi:RNA polymerase sigma factor (sigma-70 family)